MTALLQKRSRNGQAFPFPREGEVVEETPPCLIWLKEDVPSPYTVTVKKAGKTVWQGVTEQNFIVPDRIFAPGRYEWNVEADGRERGWRRFEIARNAVEFPRPAAEELYREVPSVRPRMLFFREDVKRICEMNPAALGTLRRNTFLALSAALPEAPRYHLDPEATPYREYFGRHRDYCDRDMVACALAYALLGDRAAGDRGKALFLRMCSWGTDGPCALEGPWGDEIGLSNARCFPAVMDLLWDLLDEGERVLAVNTVASYARQCEHRLLTLDYCQNPGNSHAGRLPAYLGEAAMALKGTDSVPEAELVRWLGHAADVYGGIFPYFGCPDGGWAEGMFYASSYCKWFLPFFRAVERFSRVSFFKRPFYRNYVRFLEHFCPPGWEIHPFGDGYWCGPDDE